MTIFRNNPFVEAIRAIVYTFRGILIAMIFGKHGENVDIVPGDSNIWTQVEVDGKPGMRVLSTWKVTNCTQKEIIIVRAFLGFGKIEGDVFADPIPSGESRILPIDFFLSKLKAKAGDDFQASVMLIDQYGSKYDVGRTKFSACQKLDEYQSRRTLRPFTIWPTA